MARAIEQDAQLSIGRWYDARNALVELERNILSPKKVLAPQSWCWWQRQQWNWSVTLYFYRWWRHLAPLYNYVVIISTTKKALRSALGLVHLVMSRHETWLFGIGKPFWFHVDFQKDPQLTSCRKNALLCF